METVRNPNDCGDFIRSLNVYGFKVVKPEAALRPGDRVEIYRPIICDPQTIPRRDGIGSDDE